MRFIFFMVFVFATGTISLKCQVPDKTKKYAVAAIGFWNVENLYDTINDPLKQDDEFLPDGSKSWTGDRYRKKIERLSKVISEMATDVTPDGLCILGLCEIENKNVLRDLVSTPELKPRNYQFVHFDGPDARGIDPALLYNPSYFKVIRSVRYKVSLPVNPSHKTRDQLVVSGLLSGEAVTIIVNHWPSRRGGEQATSENRVVAAKTLRHITDSLRTADPMNKIIIMGDLNDNPTNESIKKHIKTHGETKRMNEDEFFNPMETLFKQGIGTLAWEDSWNLFDQILLSKLLVSGDPKEYYKTFQYFKAFVFNKPSLSADQGNFKGYPFRTYSGGIYTGGYSDHFAVYVLLMKKMN